MGKNHRKENFGFLSTLLSPYKQKLINTKLQIN